MSNVFSGMVRLGGAAELRYLPNGSPVLTFNAASSTGFGDKQKTLWLRCSYWRNPEKLQAYLNKGDAVFVSGELSQSEYRAQDGSTKTSLELNCNIIDLIGNKQRPAEHQNAPDSGYAPSAPSGQAKRDNFDQPPIKYEDYDDDIPF
jgi:single-strand DNA-binding protein